MQILLFKTILFLLFSFTLSVAVNSPSPSVLERAALPHEKRDGPACGGSFYCQQKQYAYVSRLLFLVCAFQKILPTSGIVWKPQYPQVFPLSLAYPFKSPWYQHSLHQPTLLFYRLSLNHFY